MVVSAGLERLVRPFETPRPAPRPRAPEGDGDGEEQAVLEWAARTRVNAAIVPGANWAIVPVAEEEYEEVERVVEEERIENPDDPSQYVIVETVKEISWTDQAGVTHRYVLTETSRRT